MDRRKLIQDRGGKRSVRIIEMQQIPPATEQARATESDTNVYQEPAPAKPPERTVIKTSFNRQNTMKVIREKEEDNLSTKDWFYFDLPRQDAIEILKAKGRNKAFLLRENSQEKSPYEICMMKDGHIFILPVCMEDNKYYIRKKIYVVRNESGLNSGLNSVKFGLNSVNFEKLHDLVKYYLDGDMLAKNLDKNHCKQEALRSSKEAYRNYCNHFCHLCREFQSKIHFCHFSQKWQNFDEKNLVIIHGDSKASVERKAGFEKEMDDDGVEKDSNGENPQFHNGIDIFHSKYQMNSSLKEKRNVVELIEKDQFALKKALNEDLPKIDSLKLKADKDVPWNEYHWVSNRIEEVRKLVTGLLHIIKPLNYLQ